MLDHRLRYLMKNEVLVLAMDGGKPEPDRELGPACEENSQMERRQALSAREEIDDELNVASW